MRTPHGRVPQYHTSADNLEFIQPHALADSFRKCWRILEILEQNAIYLNLHPKCEPQLGKRGLYGPIGGGSEGKQRELAMLWVLSLSDGCHSLLDITERSGLRFEDIKSAADSLHKNALLKAAAV
jgi:aminopeptidase-like protein